MEEIRNIGYIYKITNLVNGKIYIGQTSQNIKYRWKYHINISNEKKSNYYNYPLYRAFRKYGIDNFSFEIIDECDFSELNEKEIFYIEQFNSYKKGYNQSLGGEGYRLYNLNENEVIQKYNELKNILLTAEFFSCGKSVISGILKKHKIKVKSPVEVAKDKSYIVKRYSLEGEFLEEYYSIMEASRWIKNNCETNLEPMSIQVSLRSHVKKEFPYHNFIWICDKYNEDEIKSINNNQENLKKEKIKLKETKTSKVRVKKEYFCSSCGKKISKKATLCVNCFKAEQAKNIPSRDILKQKIRTTSFLQIGKEYNVSDNSIRKWCKKYNLPFTKKEIKKYTDEEWKNV